MKNKTYRKIPRKCKSLVVLTLKAIRGINWLRNTIFGEWSELHLKSPISGKLRHPPGSCRYQTSFTGRSALEEGVWHQLFVKNHDGCRQQETGNFKNIQKALPRKEGEKRQKQGTSWKAGRSMLTLAALCRAGIFCFGNHRSHRVVARFVLVEFQCTLDGGCAQLTRWQEFVLREMWMMPGLPYSLFGVMQFVFTC